jgi:hypothetical protein
MLTRDVRRSEGSIFWGRSRSASEQRSQAGQEARLSASTNKLWVQTDKTCERCFGLSSNPHILSLCRTVVHILVEKAKARHEHIAGWDNLCGRRAAEVRAQIEARFTVHPRSIRWVRKMPAVYSPSASSMRACSKAGAQAFNSAPLRLWRRNSSRQLLRMLGAISRARFRASCRPPTATFEVTGLQSHRANGVAAKVPLTRWW